LQQPSPEAAFFAAGLAAGFAAAFAGAAFFAAGLAAGFAAAFAGAGLAAAFFAAGLAAGFAAAFAGAAFFAAGLAAAFFGGAAFFAAGLAAAFFTAGFLAAGFFGAADFLAAGLAAAFFAAGFLAFFSSAILNLLNKLTGKNHHYFYCNPSGLARIIQRSDTIESDEFLTFIRLSLRFGTNHDKHADNQSSYLRRWPPGRHASCGARAGRRMEPFAVTVTALPEAMDWIRGEAGKWCGRRSAADRRRRPGGPVEVGAIGARGFLHSDLPLV
jgi:hypothetical protein